MRPVRATAVHKTDRLAELVCSNSVRGDKLDNAVGLLKEEMRRLDSLVMRAAEASRVPAGAALAVDRERFAETITRRSPPTARHRLARGGRRDPLVHGPRSGDCRDRSTHLRGAVGGLVRLVGADHCISTTPSARSSWRRPSIGRKSSAQSRWGRSLRRPSTGCRRGPVADSLVVQLVEPRACDVDDGEGDYLKCPLTRDEYERFYDALVTAESATVHDFDKERFFEGCLPVARARRC